jgi:hypothetical protein
LESIPQISKNFLKGCIFWIVICLFLFTDLSAEINKLYLNRKYPVLQAENQLWIGTPSGLYQYNPDDDSFKRFALPIEHQSPEVKQLYFYDEWLWCVLDSGLAVLHVRLNEWLFFDHTNGLPTGSIRGVDFTGDYAWIATDNGMARFDLLIEEWEIYDEERGLPGKNVDDIRTIANQVWMITEEGFAEYDADFEKWRYYRVEQDSTIKLNRMFILGNELWFVSDGGLLRFNPQLQTQQFFSPAQLQVENLLDIIVEDERIWAITRLGLFFYEQSSAVWREFEGNSYLNQAHLVNGDINTQKIWILTDSNVLLWDREQKNWDILDYASGLSGYNYQAAYAQGGMNFMFKSDVIDYRKTEEEFWRTYQTAFSKTDGSASKNVFKSLFDNEAGGYIPFGDHRWSWSGSRITLIHDIQQQFPDGTSQTKSGERLDIKNQLALSESQTITGFYNNTDFSETMYGIRYKSREGGIIQEINWGDFRREPGSVPFSETASVFGINMWLQAGAKTPRFKRSQFNLKAHSGELRSQKTYEYYQGTTNQFQITVPDINYVKNQFYDIPNLDTLQLPEGIVLYVDDNNPTNNNANTAEHQLIAGLSGDFDLWKETEDYYFYPKVHAIRFLRFFDPAWTVVIRSTVGDQISEAILQYGETISTAKKNIYFLGGTDIIPYSFTLQITDTAGSVFPLQKFRIDDNGDGLIDSKWIDFKNGFLFFPEEEPFPSSVYAEISAQSFYHLKASYETEFALIQLENQNLVRGSEILYLDGVLAVGGNDYVLDYTNGTLVFVREGLISQDTRIEIEYEYLVTDDNDKAHSAMLNWSPSDNFYLQGDWLQFTPDAVNLFSLHSEVRQQLGDFDLKIIPALAYNTENKELASMKVDGLISSPIIRLQTVYEDYAKTYQNLYRPQSVLGEIDKKLQMFTTADIREDLRLSGEWKQVQGYRDDGGIVPHDRTGSLSMLFHRQNWPGIEVSYNSFRTQTALTMSEKYFFQNRLEYQLPTEWSQKAFLNSLRLEGFFRTGEQSGLSSIDMDKQKFQQGFIRLNTLFSDRVQGSFFYRRNDLEAVRSEGPGYPLSRSERLLFDFSHEQWRLLQLNLRAENNLQQNFHTRSSNKNLGFRQFSQVNLRLSPGQIWQMLSPLYFEFNVNQVLSGQGESSESVGTLLWQMFSNVRNRLQDTQINRSYYAKNEFRPHPNWFLHSMIEWNDQEIHIGSTQLESNYRRWSEKLVIKPGFKTRVNIQYRQYYQNLGYSRVDRYYEPSTWIEHRWTTDFQNTLNILYRYRQTRDNNIINLSHYWEARYDLIWRINEFIGIRRIEIRQSFAGSLFSDTGYNPLENYQMSSSSSLDLYPWHAMILRLRLDLNRYIDDFFMQNNYTRVMFNLKLSLRF